MRRVPLRRGGHGDGGQIIPLVIAFALLALLVVLVTADITALHLQRQRLQALTDAAALDAADALDQQSFYGAGAGTAVAPVPLSDTSVRDSVERYLRNDEEEDGAVGTARSLGVGMDGSTGAPDGVTARVTLTGRAGLPLIGFVVRRWAGGVPLHATSQARARTVAGP